MQPEHGPLPGGDPLPTLDDYLHRHGRLSDEEAEWVRTVGEELVLRRGATFCRVGRTGCGCGFLLEGVLQVYGVSPRGRRVVLDLIFPGMIALPPAAARMDTPGRTCIEAATTCTLRVWPSAPQRATSDRYPGLRRLRSRIIEDALLHGHRRYLAARTLNAEERYARMVDELPQAWRQVPQHLIASYLGITRQYLSRLEREARDAVPGQDGTGLGGRA